ncbi:MAG: adenylate/guanylate cyclase domain-containing protein, partial [Verrucomicrobiota bacterium]|nr:adenylate/guanylate cyclase domain-containing protein [Verrucomicrobiota bacterium]
KKAIGQAPTDNVEAYNYYLRGRDFLYRHSKRYYDLARRMFTKALELDPNYGRAYAGMALCDGLLLMTYKADLSTEGTLELADKALAMESNLAIAHTARGVALTIAHRFEEANREFELGIALAPTTFEVHFLSARPFFTQGNIVRAVEALERAAEIDPLDYKAPALAIHMYRSLRRASDCTAAARKTVELGEQAAVSNPEDPRPAAAVALALLELGEKEQARDWTRRAQAIESEDIVTVYNIACIYSHLAEPESACDLLEKVVRESGSLLHDWIKNDSDLDGIRDHPRFQKLLAQIG